MDRTEEDRSSVFRGITRVSERLVGVRAIRGVLGRIPPGGCSIAEILQGAPITFLGVLIELKFISYLDLTLNRTMNGNETELY